MRSLLAALDVALSQGRPCVYCSLVETRGSTPQKAGAAMLVFEDGGQVGTLGGGCVEAEVKRQALRTLSEEEAADARLLTFCLDDNYGWDDGLICGGRMSILAAPLPAARRPEHARVAEYYRHFHRLVQKGLGCTEAVVIQEKPGGAPVGSRYLLDPEGRVLDQLASVAPPAEIAAHLQPLSKRPHAYHQAGIAFIPVLPRVTLLIVGGGHVGHAVARLAADVDFDIWVLDDREAYANAERFPGARCIVGDIGQQLKALASKEIGPSVYALIVTRGHAHDEEALFHLATTAAGYVGLIGSKRKIKLIFDDLRARGIQRDVLKKVHAPLGLDIGSQTVMEIAVSIVAELIAVRNRGQTIAAARDWVDV